MAKEFPRYTACLKPLPDVLVSCRDRQGRNNALAIGFAANCGIDPALIMIAVHPSRFSHHMIKESGVFVVNLVTEDLREQYAYLGSHSGRDGDKLAALGMKIGEGTKVKAPLLLDCPVNIECTVIDSLMPGSHELFIGKVEWVRAREDLLNDRGEIDYAKLKFLKFR